MYLEKMFVAALAIGASLLFHLLRNRNFTDKTKGEPLLAEEALVHAKSDHSNRYEDFHMIHFYIPARDTVVSCRIPYAVCRRMEKGQRGILCHQGGTFYSFESQGNLICAENTLEGQSALFDL